MKFNKQEYNLLRDAATKAQVYTATGPSFGMGYNGISVAFSPVLKTGNGRMLYVAVSYCHKNDQYSRKLGRCAALRKFFDGYIVQLPLNKKLLNKGVDSTGRALLDIFEV